MKRFILLFFTLSCLLTTTFFTVHAEDDETVYHTVTIVDNNGDVVETKEVKHGETFDYVPTKEPTKQSIFEFGYWADLNGLLYAKPITEPVTLKAFFLTMPRSYNIKYVNDDGSVLCELNLTYGTYPNYEGEEPTKESLGDENYVFVGWDKPNERVEQDTVYTALYRKVITFKDVITDGDKQTAHQEAIEWMAYQNISTGWLVDNENEYRPYENLTRSQMAAFLFRYSINDGVIERTEDGYIKKKANYQINIPPIGVITEIATEVTNSNKFKYEDVEAYKEENSDLYKGMLFISNEDIATGYEQGKIFKPNDKLARADMAAFLYRIAKHYKLVSEEDKFENPFVDVKIEEWTDSEGIVLDHYKGICWMASVGITTGWENSKGELEFKPYASLARADMAAFLKRFDSVKNNNN